MTGEQMARLFHEERRRLVSTLGGDPANSLYGKAWDDLKPETRALYVAAGDAVLALLRQPGGFESRRAGWQGGRAPTPA